MSRLLIITDPQGSGNHVSVNVWQFMKMYMGGKVYQHLLGRTHEPSVDMWENPELLREFDWTQSEYFVTRCKLALLLKIKKQYLIIKTLLK